MLKGPEFGVKPSDPKKSYAQLEAENAILKERFEESELVIKELRERVQNLTAENIHKDKPRSPMCS